ncbi:MAG: hypothetical protein D3910_22340, partial [Candidatus Electrothrix sp. ATG2]|nr:hypothetical protein [Candidatus Electrothrix sp. ATG2]
MGDITIRIPQQIHIEYTLKSRKLTGRILDLLNALILRNDISAKEEAESHHLPNVSSDELRLGDLAVQLFGADAGVELELPQHS